MSLETRHSGRARQIDPAEHLAEDADSDAVEAFRQEILGAPERPMIDPPQEQFLREAFAEARDAGRPWCVLANQIPMARVHVPPMDLPELDAVRADPSHAAHAQLEGLTRRGERDLPIYLDTWDGYPGRASACTGSSRRSACAICSC